jgi:FAD/FMN-containing dehydrogenase
VSIRGGGHNVAGRAVVDDGLMIDLSLMKGIHVDAKGKTVRAQGGVTWGEFDRETLLHGLATTGGIVISTGIAGVTLGGGLGWLMGKYGLVSDNLLSVDLVTADGRVLRASEEEHSDLFWGLRGGGGNFGVVTSLEYRLHPVEAVMTGGLIVHALDDAYDLMRFYRDVIASVPDELTVYMVMTPSPDGSGTKVAALAACHCGPASDGEAALRPLKDFGSPVMDVMGPMPYHQINGMLDMGFPRGALNYWKSRFLAKFTDDAIDTMVECFADYPGGMHGGGMVLEHVHGAATRRSVDATAFPFREDALSLLILAEWEDPSDSDRMIAWAREAYTRMEPFMATGGYVNYLDDDEVEGAVAAAYGPNYERLRALKSKYDPTNLFHLNHNILPSP